MKKLLLAATAASIVMLGATAPVSAAERAALQGKVTSAQEGAMEGVLVSAKKDGSTITVTVVSDDKGHYSFPADRLSPGHYTITIRAGGYDLGSKGVATIAQGKAATADLTLVPTQDLADQLTNSEWLASMPGTPQDKKLVENCTSCHTLQRIAKSTHDEDEFMQIIGRMAGYASMSMPTHPQRLQGTSNATSDAAADAGRKKLATFLASVNRSASTDWSYKLKTLPRAKGRATHVIITEYDLLRPITEPHDVFPDKQGMVWYSDFGEQVLGSLDPKTGKVREYPVPQPKSTQPTGALDLETDAKGNLWLAMMFQGGVAEFDTKAKTWKTWSMPAALNTVQAQQSMVNPTHSNVDGKVWFNDVATHAMLRLDLASGNIEHIDPFKDMPKGRPHTPYGIRSDSHNNVYLMDFGDQNIGRVDAKTGQATIFPTPTPLSRPRRGNMDAQDRLWFAEFSTNKVAMFDTKTNGFKEWDVPTPYSAPYDAVLDKNANVWSGGMNSDLVLRLDTKTGDAVEYPLPHETNIRRVFVDNTTKRPTFWVGNNHSASIVKLEPLD